MDINTNFITLIKTKVIKGDYVFFKDFNHQVFVDSKSGLLYISNIEDCTCTSLVDNNGNLFGNVNDYIIYDEK